MENMSLMVLILAVLGLMSGSFAGATVWRLRARQLRQEASAGLSITAADKRQVKKLQKKSVLEDRSVCLNCGHTLHWYDLIPLVSWMSIGGKCRYCRTPIGVFEPLIEIGVASFFVISYLVWPIALVTPLDIAQFVIWLIAGVGMAILFAYDAKWFLLPNVVTFPLIGLGLVNAGIVIVRDNFETSTIFSIVFAGGILSGLYFILYVLSRRQWVGFGDVKLGLALALLLADWQLALLALFLANLAGTLLVVPLMAIGRVSRQTHIPFGPLLIAGWAIAGLFGSSILHWYLSATLGV